MWERTQADGKDVRGLQKDHTRGTGSDRPTNSKDSGVLIALENQTYSIISLFFHMNQPCEQDENIVGKALYDLIQIFQEIDLNANSQEKMKNDDMFTVKGTLKK